MPPPPPPPGTWILSISFEIESIKLVVFRGQFFHFKIFCFSFRQKYPQKTTNLILSISNEIERILLLLLPPLPPEIGSKLD
jgi:hypothetical protein